MRTLSILQPWAWLIVNGHKDIENRSWHTTVRGVVLVHAGKGYDSDSFEDEGDSAYGITLPAKRDLDRGGVVGLVEIVDCVRDHPSQWKNDGAWGFVLRNARPLPFLPWRGQLGFFEVSQPAALDRT